MKNSAIISPRSNVKIDLKANYVEVNSQKQYSGSELANCGIALENPNGDYMSVVLDFEKY